MAFVPISIDDYVTKFLAGNPDSERSEVTARLEETLADFKAGTRCACGARIWVIGSAEAGHGCFRCITGEAYPEEDYEIAEASTKTAEPRAAKGSPLREANFLARPVKRGRIEAMES